MSIPAAGSVGWLRHSEEGHQLYRPSRTADAGTSRVRTTKVSNRMPRARPVPIWRTWPPVTKARAPNVPASTRPAAVTVPPVASMAWRTASRGGKPADSSRMRPITRML